MFQVGQRVAEARAFDCYSQTHPSPVLVLGNAWLERMVHPVTPADQIWHCPLHPARDFYNPNAFLIAAAQQNMVPVNSSAQLSALPLGSRLFIHYNNGDAWEQGFYFLVKSAGQPRRQPPQNQNKAKRTRKGEGAGGSGGTGSKRPRVASA